MSGWAEIARETIAAVHRSLPETATLEERKKAVDAAYPFHGREMWPYKTWLKARKQYLDKFGYSRGKALPLSPLERAMATHARIDRKRG